MKKRGFTLVELLVAIAVIGILIGLLMPAIQAAREAGRRTACVNNLKQIGLALHNYHDTLKTYPSGFLTFAERTDPYAELRPPGWGWFALTLPFLEKDNLANSIDFNLAIEDTANATARNITSREFFCPSEARSATEFQFSNWEGENPWPGYDGEDAWDVTVGATNYIGVLSKIEEEQFPP